MVLAVSSLCFGGEARSASVQAMIRCIRIGCAPSRPARNQRCETIRQPPPGVHSACFRSVDVRSPPNRRLEGTRRKATRLIPVTMAAARLAAER